MADPATIKAELRRAIVARVLALESEERRAQESLLFERLPDLPGFGEARTVLLYASAFPEEVNTSPYLELALQKGKRLICPRVDRAAGCLALFEVRDLASDFRRGTLGIPEPKRTCRLAQPDEIDWALVPGLAFDPRGFRVGRGAGHYDRLLPRLRQGAPTWALILEPQWVHEIPAEPHDAPVDGVVSPARESIRAGRF